MFIKPMKKLLEEIYKKYFLENFLEEYFRRIFQKNILEEYFLEEYY